MKRFLAVFVAALLLVCLLAACSPVKTPVSDDDTAISTENGKTADATTTSTKNESQKGEEQNEDTVVTTKQKGTRPKTTTRTTQTTVTRTLPTTGPTTARPTVATMEKEYATGRKLKVACIGDSITALGYWKSNLSGELSSSNYEVKGFGVSGATALFHGVDYVNASLNGPKAYIDQTAHTESMDYGADILVIMLGTNDSKEVNWPYYGHEFTDDYIEIIKTYQNSPSEPMVFVALPPTVYSVGKFQNISNAVIENEIIPELYIAAGATGAIIIDTHTATKGDSSMVSDGVHPSEKGKKALCEAIAAAIIADTGRE